MFSSPDRHALRISPSCSLLASILLFGVGSADGTKDRQLGGLELSLLATSCNFLSSHRSNDIVGQDNGGGGDGGGGDEERNGMFASFVRLNLQSICKS